MLCAESIFESIKFFWSRNVFGLIFLNSEVIEEHLLSMCLLTC